VHHDVTRPTETDLARGSHDNPPLSNAYGTAYGEVWDPPSFPPLTGGGLGTHAELPPR
jgi:hypothetical protein